MVELITGKDGAIELVEYRKAVGVVRTESEGKIVRIIHLTLIAHVAVVKLALGFPIAAKYNSCGKRVCGVVDRHAGHICQDLSRHKVCLAGIEHRLGGNNVVIAVFRDLCPKFFGDGPIPRQTEFLMMNAQLDLKLLQALLLTGEIVNICVANIVRFPKETICAAVDDALR